MSGTNRKRAAKAIAREQGITYMQALDQVLAAETQTQNHTEAAERVIAVAMCLNCGWALERSATGWTHTQHGGKAGGDWCNPEFTLDNEQAKARPDLTPEFVMVTAVFDYSTVTVSVPFPTYDLAGSAGWDDGMGIDMEAFEDSVTAALAEMGVTEEPNDLVIDGDDLDYTLRQMVYEDVERGGRLDPAKTYPAAEVIYSRYGRSHVIDYAASITAFPISWGFCEACDAENPLDPAESEGTCLSCGSPATSDSTNSDSGGAAEGMYAISYNGEVKVEWTYIGEGWSGEYDESDPNDEALMRFDTYIRVSDDESVNEARGIEIPSWDRTCVITEGMSDEAADDCTMHDHEDLPYWALADDGSYCTQTPYDTDLDTLKKLAQLIADRLADELDVNFKHTAEEMSWAKPEWVTK